MKIRWAIATSVLLVIAFIFFFISLVTSYWSDSYSTDLKRREHFGLWRVCIWTEDNFQCNDFLSSENFNYIVYPEWLRACGAMMVFAFFFLGASLVTIILFLFISPAKGRKKTVLITCITAFFASVFIFIAAVIFAAKEDLLVGAGLKVGWSYGLAVAANVLSLIGCGLAFVQYRITYEF